MIADAHLLSEALDKGSASKRGTDFLAFFVNPEHPITPRLFVGLLGDSLPRIQADGYLGVVPLLLIGAGMVWSRNRRMILWALYRTFICDFASWPHTSNRRCNPSRCALAKTLPGHLDSLDIQGVLGHNIFSNRNTLAAGDALLLFRARFIKRFGAASACCCYSDHLGCDRL